MRQALHALAEARRRETADSAVYGHLWATPETRALFGDRGRTRAWLGILAGARRGAGRARASSRARAAEEIASVAPACELDLEAVGEETRRSGHSTLGLIRVLQRELGPGGRGVGLPRRDGPGRLPTRGPAW